MLSYSPYDNVRSQAYPAMLVTTGLWDSQVQYFEPAKWVARLRAAQDRRPTRCYLRVEMEAGHGGRTGRFRQLHESAEDYAFILDQVGLADVPEERRTSSPAATASGRVPRSRARRPGSSRGPGSRACASAPQIPGSRPRNAR